MNYREKYEKLVEQIRKESDRANKALENEKDCNSLTLFNMGSVMTYNTIFILIEMLEQEK